MVQEERIYIYIHERTVHDVELVFLCHCDRF